MAYIIEYVRVIYRCIIEYVRVIYVIYRCIIEYVRVISKTEKANPFTLRSLLRFSDCDWLDLYRDIPQTRS